jgi:mannose-6-phosphate isomerase-like protein (cupin superfamily)
MRVLTALFSVVLLSAPAFAQAPAAGAAAVPNLKTLAASADVAAAAARLKSQRTNQPLMTAPLLQLDPYRVNLEYRAAVGNAATHETEAELFYVVDGSATLVTGGELVESQRTNPENLSGKSIKGGTSQRVAKGDFFIVAQGVPHWFSTIDGTVTLMSVHLPRK